MKATKKAWAWAKTHPLPVLGVSVPGLVAVAVYVFSPPAFPVPEGHLFTVQRPKTQEGEWLDIDRLASLIRDALDRSVGPPRPLGSGSYPLKKWKDKTSDGKPYDVRAGIWSTDFHAAPAGSPWAEVSLRVHFWIERHEDKDTEGDLHLAIVARAKPPGGGAEVELDRTETEQAIQGFLALIR